MTEFTRPATWEDVKRVVALLNEAGVAYALVGGYALAAHGYVRFSEDVAILVDPSPENARKWITALAQLPDGASRELVSEEDIFLRGCVRRIRRTGTFWRPVLPNFAIGSSSRLAPWRRRLLSSPLLSPRG